MKQVLFGTRVKGAINDSGKIIRRPQQHREDRGGGGAYRYTHGHGERPGLCGARFRRHAESAGCAPSAAASGSTHRCATAATASPSTSAGSAEEWLQRLLLWQLWQSGRRRRWRWRLENYEPPLTIWTTQSGWVKPNAARITPRTWVESELNAEYGFAITDRSCR
jgi:hypothetical protein